MEARQKVISKYDEARRRFSWTDARALLDGLPNGGGLNIAHEAVTRHARGARRDHVALRWLGKSGATKALTYADLERETNRFANVLSSRGVKKGDRVFVLAGRIPELYVAVLGTLKNGSVLSPLFSAFGPEPIRARLQIGEAVAIVTTESLYRKKVLPLRDAFPHMQVFLVGDDGRETSVEGTIDWARAMAGASDAFEIAPTDPEQMALLHFTSGTTGKPKGAIHVHQAVVAHHVTGRLALDLHGDDVFWCTADPGWVTGMSYGILSPLTNGVTIVVDEADFDAERWYQILDEQKVTVWYTAPTAVRMMMRGGADAPKRRAYPSLRFIASVGEPLNPEAVFWGLEAFGLPIHDNWWQTETGGIMIANTLAMDVRPGSMGRPLPGVEAVIVRRSESGAIEIVDQPDAEGELALRVPWPSMFRGYLGESARYEKCFVGDLYLSGDLAKRDADGYFWFIGRADDVIKSSGHLIGPFEVESALLEHPAVAEAGVIGKPDPMAMEIVKAFEALKPGHEASEELMRELLGFARKRLGAAVAPKEIAFLATLPRTRSGKIMRRLSKARELGLPEGDTSTLEGPT